MSTGEATITQRSTAVSPEAILYSAYFCPFGQRAWIALEGKGVNYQWKECTIYNGKISPSTAMALDDKRKLNPGFIECSPRGLVPGLEHGEVKVYESGPVIEYIEEAFDQNHPLMPSDPAERAKIRIAISLYNELVVRRWYGLLMAPPEDWEKSKESLAAGFEEIMGMFTSEGPFFSKFGFSLFECASLPWLQRTYSVLKEHRNFSLPADKFKRLHDWYQACLQVPAFANTLVRDATLIEAYAAYGSTSPANR